VDDAREFSGVVDRWDAELRAYEKVAKDWIKCGQGIVDRYALKDQRERPEYETNSRFNILWSNIQTQSPSLFSRPPVPSIERRHKDRDQVTRLAAEILERSVATELEFDDIEHVLRRVSLDFQLVGRGVPWVRYDADIRESEVSVLQLEDGRFTAQDGRTFDEAEPGDAGFFVADREVVDERAPVDYIHWKDFFHKPVKSWEELRRSGWIAKRVKMTRAAGRKEFGDVFKDVPLKAIPEGMDETETKDIANIVKQAEVYEIWDAVERKVIWINRDKKDRPLKVMDDPLGLRGFFPVPRPVLATVTNDGLIPTPDFEQYSDLADELDDLTERIGILTKALKVKGIYDASMEGLATLLSDTTPENEMISVTNMAAYLAKGSGGGGKLQNVVQFMPIDMIAAVLIQLHDARDRVKATLFEVSGISDIMRGQVDPREKLGQSRIKGQFGTLRLGDRQKELARLARDVIRIKSEIIAEHFDDTTLREISGFDTLPEIQALQEPGEAERLFAGALEIIRQDRTRGFRIDIETDSTVALDEEEQKQSRIEFLSAVGSFMESSVPLAQQSPQLAPVMAELLLFGVRAFKAGRSVESVFEAAIDELKLAAQEPQEPEPDPAMLQLQADQQAQQAQMQADQQAKAAELQGKQQMAQAEMELKREIAQLDAQTKLQIEAAKMNRERERAQVEDGFREREFQGSDAGQALARLEQTETTAQVAVQTMQALVQQIQGLVTILSAPKTITPRRENGRLVGGTVKQGDLETEVAIGESPTIQ
jgi:hypothetical protein